MVGWDGASGVTTALRLAWLGTGEVPPQGPVTREEPKGRTSWPPYWAWLWAKSRWFEEQPAAGGFLTDVGQQRHPISLPPFFFASQAPSVSLAGRELHSPLHNLW